MNKKYMINYWYEENTQVFETSRGLLRPCHLRKMVREALSCKGFTCTLPASFHLACWLTMNFLCFDAQHLPAKLLLALCLPGAQQNCGFLPTGSPTLERSHQPCLQKVTVIESLQYNQKSPR